MFSFIKAQPGNNESVEALQRIALQMRRPGGGAWVVPSVNLRLPPMSGSPGSRVRAPAGPVLTARSQEEPVSFWGVPLPPHHSPGLKNKH